MPDPLTYQQRTADGWSVRCTRHALDLAAQGEKVRVSADGMKTWRLVTWVEARHVTNNGKAEQ